MAHGCFECGQMCYCDGEDHENPTPDDCSHVCEPQDDDDDYPDYIPNVPDRPVCTRCDHELIGKPGRCPNCAPDKETT